MKNNNMSLSFLGKKIDIPRAYRAYAPKQLTNAYLMYTLVLANEESLIPKGRKSKILSSSILWSSIYDRFIHVTEQYPDMDYWQVLVYVSTIFYTHMYSQGEKYSAIAPDEIDSTRTLLNYSKVQGRVEYRYINLPSMGQSFAIATPWNVGDSYDTIRSQVLKDVFLVAPDCFNSFLSMSSGEILYCALKMPEVILAPSTVSALQREFPKTAFPREIMEYNTGMRGLDIELCPVKLDERLGGKD